MAKDGKKTGKLPKQIGGVKIPKELRKGAEKLVAKAQSPEGRAAIAKGAVMVAGMAATMAQASAAKKAGVQPVKPSVPPVPGQPAGNDALADAIGAGVDAVLGRLFPKK
ncbi:hypothetical protein [Sphingomonas sp.]|jgi:hypothetical protein|uniref:hypothetical protein n=1 Tax=Sphingomonas sp. TaxID=28214 RepID=UPI002D7F01BB|nr:hypothetical protein [Sphingomonas sp.]HEU0045870.1 hypothetical protein [Sphingomonas sp.]